ncbi:PP-loop family-domain-containing protein [Phaeosphaeria sp. MPI-PUGE-AT-0046c]|nr:PP-loop family-domain-containing protein [Phaeosphaeria sp. MPI-PUGE-AT-0046c]
MALAHLYARAREANGYLPKAHGFVVDHKARPESTEEAHWVADQLRSRHDMQASVLTLTWPESFDMTDQKRFETEARTRRYQALGRACRNNRLNALILAHHGDDQAETVLMRLSNNRVRTGLKAMQSVEWIPECEGIYGVHHSGSWDIHNPRLPRKTWRPPFAIEQGGIQILRPLLAMEKSRLVATCELHDVPWAEDKSNEDRTLTSRNAIRHMYNHHPMPKALSISSLVNLSLNMQKRVAAHQTYAKGLYDQCLFKLNIRTGSLTVRFPPFSALLARPIQTESDKAEARNNAYYLLEQVADLVTPKMKVATGQLDTRVDSIYPEFQSSEEKDELTTAAEADLKEKFTVFGVWWRKLEIASPFEDNGLPSPDHYAVDPHPSEWLLSRQTLENHERDKVQHIVPPSATQTSSTEPGAEKETFHLFDGRFWIQVVNHTHDNLILRTFEKADMGYLPTLQKNREAIRNRTGPKPERFITAAFAAIRPHDIRFTLPAVFRKDSLTGEESLIGFPTLNLRMGGIGAPREICDWQVRYKKINFGSHSAEDIIVGLYNDDFVNLEKQDRMANKGILKMNSKRKQLVGEDAFTGYKRISPLAARNMKKEKDIRQQLQHAQRAMEGEEVDGFLFLQDESDWQNGPDVQEDEEKGKSWSARQRDRWS